MRFASVAAKPVSAKASRIVRAGVVMDTIDMSFDAMPTRRRYPSIPTTTLANVIERDWAPRQPVVTRT
jgi:hypothetical protein